MTKMVNLGVGGFNLGGEMRKIYDVHKKKKRN